MSPHLVLKSAAAAWTVAAAFTAPLAQAATPMDALPGALGVGPARAVSQVLARMPGYQGALRGVDAERAFRRQMLAGTAEWTASMGLARVSDSGPPSSRSNDLELGLERSLRLPGKARVHGAVGDARAQLAQTQTRKVWNELARQLTLDLVAWQREERSLRVWRAQAELLAVQRDSVAKRQQLGDAALLEQRQAAAAHAQALAQQESAQARVDLALQGLATRYPGLPLQPAGFEGLDLLKDLAAAPPGQAWVEQALSRSTALQLVRDEALALEAQARMDAAETQADPTLGVRFARARNGQENTVVLTLSLPFAGEHRRAMADASAARAAAAQWAVQDAEQRWRADALQRQIQAAAYRAAWQRAQSTAEQLEAIAAQVARGYQLGEGALSDVLAARRLSNEQQLASVQAAMDLLQAQALMALDAGELWPADELAGAAPVP